MAIFSQALLYSVTSRGLVTDPCGVIAYLFPLCVSASLNPGEFTVDTSVL